MTRRESESGSYPAISEYALLSDCHGAALVSRAGSVDWCCLQRFDSRPVFSRLLDWKRGGHFRIAPPAESEASRRYLEGTHVLETRFATDDGVLLVTDFLVVVRADGDGSGGDDGTRHPVAEDRLIRRVTCEGGRVDAQVEFVPRFDFGATTPHLRRDGDDVVIAYGGADALVLQVPDGVEIAAEGRAVGTLRLHAGESREFVLSYSQPHRIVVDRLDMGAIEDRLRLTTEFWREWLDRCRYQGQYAEAVHRSALVLKALTNVRTGAIVAAPTTSLPEQIGGVRNWDYRYTWLRDASFVIDVLYLLGFGAEGHEFMQWLQRTTAGLPDQLQIMYGEAGETLLPEIALRDVAGYRGSRPVHVGNAASEQFQLDVYGELIHAAWRYHRHGGEIDDDEWSLICGLVRFVEQHWEEPDCGLWEVRSGPEHFVFSKVMCWVAVDRALKLAEELGRKESVEGWIALRQRIRERVLRDGVCDGRFVRALGSEVPDASLLLIPLVGFIPPDDPISVRTREWIEEHLVEQCLVRRYRVEDGLPGHDGAFVICTFWLVELLARSGEVNRAREMFERLLAMRNDLGLLSEEIGVGTGEFLGNFPQALSHIGLINAALVLEDASSEPKRHDGEAPGPS